MSIRSRMEKIAIWLKENHIDEDLEAAIVKMFNRRGTFRIHKQ